MFGNLEGVFASSESGDIDCDEVCGTFGVTDDACGEVSADLCDCGGDGGEVSWSGLKVCSTTGEQEDSIAGAHMAIDADAVEGFGDGCFQDLRAIAGREFGIGEDDCEHGGHVGGDHGGAFADAGDTNDAS